MEFTTFEKFLIEKNFSLADVAIKAAKIKYEMVSNEEVFKIFNFEKDFI